MRHRVTCFALAAVCLLGACGRTASSATLAVDAKSNIFGAGHAECPPPASGTAGILPPVFSFAALPDQQIAFSAVTGSIGCCGDPNVLNGPDGGPFASASTNILSIGGIAGIIDNDHTLFLVGVFLDDTEPADPAPSRLDFSAGALGESFVTLSPQLRQVFFIGDGLTGNGTGVTQRFNVPAGATRMFLGFADGHEFGDPTRLPGSYGDNLGTLSTEFALTSSAPTAVSSRSWGRLKTIYR